MTTEAPSLTARLRSAALRLGFDLVGVTDVRPSEHAAFYRQWLEDGYHGTMGYLARPDAVARRLDPRSAFPELRSAVVVAMGYDPGASTGEDGAGDARPSGPATQSEAATAKTVGRDAPSSGSGPSPLISDPSRAILARYALGRDYHRVMKRKLLQLLRWLEGEVGHELPAARAYVDTGPVLERELARRAGLGWFGRSAMLIHPRRGSYFFLGSLLVELELEPDEPFEADHCGTCSACVDACPTGALLGKDAAGAPTIDATRCIAYLTIENRGPIPRELRPAIGNRVFGCDICQEVCPFTRRFSEPTTEPAFAARGPGEPPHGVQPLPSDTGHPGTDTPPLVELMAMDEAEWESFSRGSPIRRAGRAGFLRNVAVAIGNWLRTVDEPPAEAVAVLARALDDEDPLVREHAAWALGRAGTGEARGALEGRMGVEGDPAVREEIGVALEG